MRKVACPSCQSSYDVDERRIPASGMKMRCPKCSASFQVMQDGTTALARTPEPYLDPWIRGWLLAAEGDEAGGRTETARTEAVLATVLAGTGTQAKGWARRAALHQRAELRRHDDERDPQEAVSGGVCRVCESVGRAGERERRGAEDDDAPAGGMPRSHVPVARAASDQRNRSLRRGACTPAEDRSYWFGLLDAWGAPGRSYREIASWLTVEQGLSAWWAQKVIVEYEQARGLRAKHQMPDGFQVSASRTITAPNTAVFQAWNEARTRARWLPESAGLEAMSTTAERRLSFAGPGDSRIEVRLLAKNAERTQVTVQERKLPNATAAKQRKVYWAAALDALQARLGA